MTILQKLEDKRVFSIAKTGDDFEFIEECDRWFGATLTRDEVLQLAAELVALAGDTA